MYYVQSLKYIVHSTPDILQNSKHYEPRKKTTTQTLL